MRRKSLADLTSVVLRPRIVYSNGNRGNGPKFACRVLSSSGEINEATLAVVRRLVAAGRV